jgi:hypothetical protein
MVPNTGCNSLSVDFYNFHVVNIIPLDHLLPILFFSTSFYLTALLVLLLHQLLHKIIYSLACLTALLHSHRATVGFCYIVRASNLLLSGRVRRVVSAFSILQIFFLLLGRMFVQILSIVLSELAKINLVEAALF